MRDDCQWMNFRWAIDVQYTHIENCPILAKLVDQYKLFWDGQYCYVRQKSFILRFPDWRSNYRVDLESWKRHHGDPKQKKLI